ncbi:MAG: substrate-binding domain-containing protein [Solirubrobacteraceae bacterium]
MAKVGSRHKHWGRATVAVVVGVASVASLVGVTSSALASSSGATPVASTAAAQGKVSAIFAGSLVDIMEKSFGPAFTQTTGYPFEGFGGGSNEDAAAIKGKVRTADVFLSASASADKELEGAANGNWVSWYSTFASSNLVLGYDPKTKFGKELAHGKPWYKVISEPGILVGRTEPKADPKGKLTVEAVDAAAKKLHDPKLTKALKSFPIFEETTMLARLQAGQLDAGFFYVVEAKEAHVPTVPLTPVYKYADYTLTILNNAENPAGAEALVSFLLSPKRKTVEGDYGLVPLKPTFTGSASAVPKGLRSIVGAG